MAIPHFVFWIKVCSASIKRREMIMINVRCIGIVVCLSFLFVFSAISDDKPLSEKFIKGFKSANNKFYNSSNVRDYDRSYFKDGNSFFITENSKETGEWKLTLINSARKSIEISGTFCGGHIYREALRMIYKNMEILNAVMMIFSI